MICAQLIKHIKALVPRSIKLFVHCIFDRLGRRNIRYLRGAASVSASFGDEIILCSDGDVFVRDKQGLEFLLPINLIPSIKKSPSKTEPLESKLLIANVQSDSPVVLDVGANVGLHSIRIAHARPLARIHAFEPVTANYQVLCKNVSRNDFSKIILPNHVAIGAEDGQVSIPAGYGTANSIGDRNSSDRETITARSIDSYLSMHQIKQVHLIKADVEGYELNVLHGARQCLEQSRPKLLLEISDAWCKRIGYRPDEIFEFLKGLDYDYLRLTTTGEILPPSGSLIQDLKEGNNFCFFPCETTFAID